MWWQMSVKLSNMSNSIIKQLHARLLSNGNNVVIKCVINKCKHISILCKGNVLFLLINNNNS